MPYEKLVSRLATVRSRLGRPLTLSEKVLYSHIDDPAGQDIVRGESYLRLRPDRVAMQVRKPFAVLLQIIHYSESVSKYQMPLNSTRGFRKCCYYNSNLFSF